jgi:methyltransferase-like protein 6
MIFRMETHKKSTQNIEVNFAPSKTSTLLSDFKKNKLIAEAKKNWDLFYKRNKTNFFKDRYWTLREFEELNESNKPFNLLEVGCGVGNFLYPLLNLNKNIHIDACDFSDKAIELLKSNEDYQKFKDRLNAFVCDLTKDDLRANVKEQVEAVSMIFVLSAIPKDKLRESIKNVFEVLKPGGVVLVRDYGYNDYTMIKFENGVDNKIDERSYVRCDNTLTHYFELHELDNLFFNEGFEKKINEYVLCETINIKENLKAQRVFVQAKFFKPK